MPEEQEPQAEPQPTPDNKLEASLPETQAPPPVGEKVKKSGKDKSFKKKLRRGYKARYQTSDEKVRIKYEMNGPQKEFSRLIESGKRVILFNGGRQGGKTFAGAREALKQIYKYCRKPALGWIISPTYPMSLVVERTFEEAAGWFDSGGLILKKMTGKRSYLMHPPAGSTEPYVVEIKTAEHPNRLRGAAPAWIWMDEAAMMSEEVFKIILGTQLVSNGIIFMTSTPRGHNWFYKLYIEADKNPMIGAVTGKSKDNKHLSEDAYNLMRNRSSEDFARQELEAEFVSFEGLVYRGFNYNRHVIPTLIQLPPGSEVVCGIDNGYGDPFACLWVAKHDGKYYVIDEYYEKGRTLDSVARSIKSRSWDRHVIRRWADPSGAQERAELDKFGISTYPARNDVFSGINCVERLFEQGRLFISVNCINTLSEITQYHYKDNPDRNKGEEPVDAYNHAMDALRYAIFSESEFAVAHPIVHVRPDGSIGVDRGSGSYLDFSIEGLSTLPTLEEAAIGDEYGSNY